MPLMSSWWALSSCFARQDNQAGVVEQVGGRGDGHEARGPGADQGAHPQVLHPAAERVARRGAVPVGQHDQRQVQQRDAAVGVVRGAAAVHVAVVGPGRAVDEGAEQPGGIGDSAAAVTAQVQDEPAQLDARRPARYRLQYLVCRAVPIRTCTRVLARSGAAGGGAAGAAATPGWIRPTTPLAPDPARQLTTSWRPEGSARLAEPVSGVGPLARISAEIRSLRPANRQVSELRAFWIGERATSRAQPRDR